MRISDWSSDVCSSDLLTAELRQAAASAGNIHLQLEYLSDAEIERITDEADAVVLPYRDIVNSGSALLALSRFRPVIAPRSEERRVGKACVSTCRFRWSPCP